MLGALTLRLMAPAGTCPTCGSFFLRCGGRSSPVADTVCVDFRRRYQLPPLPLTSSGIIGTTPIFVSPYRSYSTDTDGASDTTHTCCYGPLRKARRLVDVIRVTRGSGIR